MNIYFANATVGAGQHSGSAAATESVQRHLIKEGHVIAQVHLVNNPPDPAGKEIEAVVVNGEGTMHHEAFFAMEVMQLLRHAQSRGIKTYVVNAMWQKMGRAKDIIANLDAMWVRDHYSLKEARKDGANPILRMESACDRGILERGKAVTLSDSFHGRQWPAKEIEDAPEGSQPLLLEDHRYEDIVATLKNARSYTTGQYHGMVAADLAGCTTDHRPTNDTWKVKGWQEMRERINDLPVWNGLQDLDPLTA